MRRIVMLNWLSVDGFFAGPNGEIDWLHRDPAVQKALREPGAGKESVGADTMLLGSVTYELFENSWPPIAKDLNASEEMRRSADEITRMMKLVFSRTRQQVLWENSRLFRGNLIEVVNKLKQEQGKDIIIFGSGTLVQQLTDAALIDDYFIALTPVVLGKGKPLFGGVQTRNLHLLEVQHFNSGNVLLHYRVKKVHQ